ncbi:MAG: DUF998 domain-containing protein [Candidatus Thorarchaeota archaeon]|nr:DUF998 domain-containing protein [Candidatus Thorarchaeota archaeon]
MSEVEKHPALSRVGILGMIGPLIALVCIMIAIALAPAWTWEGNALSDLGHWFRTDIGPNPSLRAFVFCFGLVATGILLFVFTVWFLRRISDTITKIGFLPFFSALIFLMLIGIIAENFDGHYEVSVGFFFSFPWAMWIIGIGLFRYKHLWWFAIVSIILPFFSVYMWAGWTGGLFPFWIGNAIPEITTALSAIGWLWVMWFLYYKSKLSPIMADV